MFPNTNLLVILVPAALLAMAVNAFFRNRREKQASSELAKALDNLKVMSITFGALVLLLWLLLPPTSSLQSFDYPANVSVLKDEARTLRLLQAYNQAIVRTTSVVYWFLFLFVWWFLTALFGVAKAFRTAPRHAPL